MCKYRIIDNKSNYQKVDTWLVGDIIEVRNNIKLVVDKITSTNANFSILVKDANKYKMSANYLERKWFVEKLVHSRYKEGDVLVSGGIVGSIEDKVGSDGNGIYIKTIYGDIRLFDMVKMEWAIIKSRGDCEIGKIVKVFDKDAPAMITNISNLISVLINGKYYKYYINDIKQIDDISKILIKYNYAFLIKCKTRDHLAILNKVYTNLNIVGNTNETVLVNYQNLLPNGFKYHIEFDEWLATYISLNGFNMFAKGVKIKCAISDCTYNKINKCTCNDLTLNHSEKQSWCDSRFPKIN